MSDLTIAIVATIVGGVVVAGILSSYTFLWKRRAWIWHVCRKIKEKPEKDAKIGLQEYITNFSRWTSDNNEGISITVYEGRQLVYKHVLSIDVIRNKDEYHVIRLIIKNNVTPKLLFGIKEAEIQRIAKNLYYKELVLDGIDKTRN